MSKTEVRGIVSSKQGLSCEGFYTLSNATAHLREHLYVSAMDGEKMFMPKGLEHFPCKEIETYYVDRMNYGFFQSIGAGGGKVVFACEADSPEVAEEGAEILSRTLVEIDALINQDIFGRWRAAIPQKKRYLVLSGAFSKEPPAYRPERLPARSGVPEPISAEERTMENDRTKVSNALGIFEEKKREALARFGMLEDYDRAQTQQKAQAAGKARESPYDFQRDWSGRGRESWKESPWR